MGNRVEQIIQQRQQRLRAIIQQVSINRNYTYDDSGLIEQQVGVLADTCEQVLDIGKSSRQFFDRFKAGQVTTLDINRYQDYPDIVDDICEPLSLQPNSWDGLVCLSVIEHVYDPPAAVNTLWRCLRPGGRAFVHVPFVFRYHAPKDLYFQDYFRFTRDGVAYLFRDFENVTLYPVRGRLSSALNLQRYWKRRIERRFGHRVNRVLDRIYDRFTHASPPELQTSGYFITAIKPRDPSSEKSPLW